MNCSRFAFVDLQAKEAFGIGAVADPVGGRDAVDPSLYRVPLGSDGQAIPTLGDNGFASSLMFLQPQRVEIAAA